MLLFVLWKSTLIRDWAYPNINTLVCFGGNYFAIKTPHVGKVSSFVSSFSSYSNWKSNIPHEVKYHTHPSLDHSLIVELVDCLPLHPSWPLLWEQFGFSSLVLVVPIVFLFNEQNHCMLDDKASTCLIMINCWYIHHLFFVDLLSISKIITQLESCSLIC